MSEKKLEVLLSKKQSWSQDFQVCIPDIIFIAPNASAQKYGRPAANRCLQTSQATTAAGLTVKGTLHCTLVFFQSTMEHKAFHRLTNTGRPSPWCVSNDSVIAAMKVWHFRVISMCKQLYVMAWGDISHKHIINATKQTAGSAPSQQQGPPCVLVKDTLTKMDTPALRCELTGRSPTVQDGHFTHKN